MQSNNVLTQTNRGPNTSDKYKTITTQTVLDVFQSRGFEIESVSQSRAIKKENMGFEKHLVKLSVPQTLAKFKIEGLAPKLYVRNSYNADTSLQIYFGIFRLVCTNGLVVGTNVFKNRVLHVGDVNQNLHAAIDRSLNAFDLIANAVNHWTSIELNQSSQLELARRLATIRLPKDTSTAQHFISAGLLIKPARFSDVLSDAFTVFNRIQERLLQRPQNTIYTIKSVNDKGIESIESRRLRKLNATNEVLMNAKLWDETNDFLKEIA